MRSVDLNNLPLKAKYIEKALLDLHQICIANNIEYRVVGSTAVVGAVNNLYRIPHDVDFIYDSLKSDVLAKELVKLGYKKVYQKFPLPVIVHPLIHYTKGDMLIEPRGGDFTDRGFEFPLRLPLPISKQFWPHLKLVFCPAMLKACEYKFGTATYIGLSAESLWIGLDIFLRVMESLKDKVEKRTLDFNMLSQVINTMEVTKIKKDKPGIYYGRLPLATLEHNELISIVALLIRMKNWLHS